MKHPTGWLALLVTAMLQVFSGPLGAEALVAGPSDTRLQAVASTQEIELYAGESRVLPAVGVTRVAVGNGAVMAATVLDDNEVLLFANSIGTSALFIWQQDGRRQQFKVTIVPGETGRVAREVAAFLTRIPKANAAVVGDKVIVEGDELSDADQVKVAELAKRYPQIVNFTSPIGWEQMVLMDLRVVEFPKSVWREWGLKWGVNGAIRAHAEGRRLPAVVTLNLLAELRLLEGEGNASILAEPQLSTRSGSKASFLAGGEIAYTVATLDGPNVQFKPYGVHLDIKPKVGRNGVIRAEIDAEVSSVDGSVSLSAGPALLTRRTRAEFNLRAGETIMLSGLLQRETRAQTDKVPLLGELPVVGPWFRSRRLEYRETELVIFVTPTIVDSRTPAQADRIERSGERLEQALDSVRDWRSGPANLSQPKE